LTFLWYSNTNHLLTALDHPSFPIDQPAAETASSLASRHQKFSSPDPHESRPSASASRYRNSFSPPSTRCSSSTSNGDDALILKEIDYIHDQPYSEQIGSVSDHKKLFPSDSYNISSPDNVGTQLSGVLDTTSALLSLHLGGIFEADKRTKDVPRSMDNSTLAQLCENFSHLRVLRSFDDIGPCLPGSYVHGAPEDGSGRNSGSKAPLSVSSNRVRHSRVDKSQSSSGGNGGPGRHSPRDNQLPGGGLPPGADPTAGGSTQMQKPAKVVECIFPNCDRTYSETNKMRNHVQDDHYIANCKRCYTVIGASKTRDRVEVGRYIADHQSHWNCCRACLKSFPISGNFEQHNLTFGCSTLNGTVRQQKLKDGFWQLMNGSRMQANQVSSSPSAIHGVGVSPPSVYQSQENASTVLPSNFASPFHPQGDFPLSSAEPPLFDSSQLSPDSGGHLQHQHGAPIHPGQSGSASVLSPGNITSLESLSQSQGLCDAMNLGSGNNTTQQTMADPVSFEPFPHAIMSNSPMENQGYGEHVTNLPQSAHVYPNPQYKHQHRSHNVYRDPPQEMVPIYSTYDFATASRFGRSSTSSSSYQDSFRNIQVPSGHPHHGPSFAYVGMHSQTPWQPHPHMPAQVQNSIQLHAPGQMQEYFSGPQSIGLQPPALQHTESFEHLSDSTSVLVPAPPLYSGPSNPTVSEPRPEDIETNLQPNSPAPELAKIRPDPSDLAGLIDNNPSQFPSNQGLQ
jgi:hypothetical protein